MSDQEDIARRAFDAVADAQKAKTVPELEAIVSANLAPLGYNWNIGVDFSLKAGVTSVLPLFGSNHRDWEEHYQARNYSASDGMIAQALNGTDPFFWDDVLKRNVLDAPALRIMDEARDFGLLQGFVTPLFQTDGSVSLILLCGQQIDVADPDVRAASHLLSVYYGSIGRRLKSLSQPVEHGPARLTRRQIECLKWVRAGKSSTDIGDILGISEHTVREHVSLACNRLGVRTRTQAVVEAAAMGLLTL